MKLKKQFFLILLLLFTTQLSCCSNNSYSTFPLQVYFFDVGQGDSTLIKYKDFTMLIDSGPRDYEDELLDYLSKLNITTIDYLIMTHPHEDHIGNTDEIIDTLTVKNIYAPNVDSPSAPVSDILSALNRKKLKINILDENTSLFIDDDINISVFYPPPNLITDNLNNYSAIIKIDFKDTSFLFTGDAEIDAHNYLYSNYNNLDIDVLKLGHHGSKTSTTEEFLKFTTPSISIASCGENNNYNHPNKETIALLENFDIPLLRTDLMGTILLLSNGTDIYTKK
ncbi:MAG: ComEC/Rec2 family competence protein [Clostridium sp.]|uniref:ComEC/Rec2 family competence protein n=1 Tax=Clostridium sp. TaxID=1506 RepID=UPI003EE63941